MQPTNEYCHVKICCTNIALTQQILDAINTVVLDYTRDKKLFYSVDTAAPNKGDHNETRNP